MKDVLRVFGGGLITLLVYLPYIYFAAIGKTSYAIIGFTAATIVVVGLACIIVRFLD